MSVTLLLDSSDKDLLVAISCQEKILSKTSYPAWQRQSEMMVQEIDAILSKNSLNRNDIDGVVVSKGPGSYTGVRIALTIAKTISFALDVPLYLASSLEVLQMRGKPSICLSNARGKRSYVGFYGFEEAKDDTIMSNEEVLDYLSSHPDVIACGDLSYIGKEGYRADVAFNLACCVDEAHRCLSPLGARPIYLKDDYGQGSFKTIVRKMLPSDLSQVMAIENASFKHPYTEEQIIGEMTVNPLAYLYSAVVDSEVVGFINFMITFNSATISQIAVREDFRRKGIGNLLLGQMLKECHAQSDPVEFVTLEVRASNEKAQRFYKKHKFEIATTKKNYYDDGEDAIYMVRCIIND